MILIIIGILSGFISGMGIGGGTILIPSLTIFAETSQHMSQSINLIYFIPTAVAALIIHIKNKIIKKEILIFLIIGGVFGALLGSSIANYLESIILKKLFAIFLFFMGIVEIKKTKKEKKGK
ncbi:TSUP family transporter [Defluviitalea phaphyphila]|uniref:TSUP family transporter n=1 Tax=Defluviitalea phaphyphila TaxID=1473580 RepID=UPI0007315285|nr:TSUP family transporter [Defluviitalea phaphyphila]